jgi:hypothetical protein
MDKPINEAVYGVGQWKKEDVGSEEKNKLLHIPFNMEQ